MKISLLTDAPKHNLALMKLSTYHKTQGHEVWLNAPLFAYDYIYASVLYERNINEFSANEYGGAAFEATSLPKEIESLTPDYDLFNLNYSLGYTFRPCYNECHFCKVSKMEQPDHNHHSIFEFHNPKFDTICLLNNNTFQDPLWKDTFKEIWDADLIVIDENGYDIRLLDDEKAKALKKTKFRGKIHFAWDRLQDEALIIEGLKTLRKYKFNGTTFYVLIGYNTTIEEDLYRCQKIVDYKQTPYIMPYVASKKNKKFKRFIDTFMWRKYKTIKDAWNNYK